MAAMSFVTWLTEHVAPVWLRRTWGNKFVTVLGEQADRLSNAAKDAVKCGMPESSPADALPYNGAARNLERYFYDSDAAFRARVVEAWTIWEAAGTAAQLIKQLGAAGYEVTRIHAWRNDPGTMPHPYEDHWSSFIVIVDQPHPYTVDGLWSDGGTWGDTVTGNYGPDGPGTWDSTATEYEVNEVRRLIRKWRPSSEICLRIVFVIAGDLWEDLAPWDNGTWGDDDDSFYWQG